MGEWFNSLAQLLVAPLVWLISLIALAVDFCSLPFRKKLRDPKSILITGATSGIGEALAVHYAQPGVTLSLTGRNRQALQETERKCAAKGAKVYTKAIDVTDRDALSSWIHEVDQKDPIDMVFANAGVTENTTNTVNDLEAAARTVFDINVTGVFNTIFPVIPAMKERGYGQVVLLSSLASFGALNNSAAYCASKAAIRVYGDGLRTDLLRYGIHVNVVCPGFVKSPMTDANKFPQPGKVSMEYAINYITKALAWDERHVAFPTLLYVGSIVMGYLSSSVRDVLARFKVIPQIAYMRKSSKKTAATGQTTVDNTGADARADSKSSRRRQQKEL